MALHTYYNETVGTGGTKLFEYLVAKLTELGWEAEYTGGKLIITKFGTMENVNIYYPSTSSVSSGFKLYPYYDVIICDDAGKEFILILDNVQTYSSSSGVTSLGTNSTFIYISFFLGRNINGDVIHLDHGSNATTFEGVSFMTFPLAQGRIYPASTGEIVRLTQCLSINLENSQNYNLTTANNYGLTALEDISNIYLFTANHSLSPGTVYTDDAGVEYIGIHELFALRKDIYE